MALLKIVQVGDELVFEVPPSDRPQRISIRFPERTGRAVALNIKADRSIPITHIRAGTVDMGDPESIDNFTK